MATTLSTRLQPRLSRVVLSLVRSAVYAIVTAVLSWRNRRMVTNMLELDDRLLADIGLTRGDVAASLASPGIQDPSARLAGFAHERRHAIRAGARERLARLEREA